MDADTWLQPTATLVSAALVLLGAGMTIRQRRRADRKEQWWSRTQWALDLLVSGRSERALLGAQVLAHQVQWPTADDEDAALVRDVVTPTVDGFLRGLDTTWPSDDTDKDDEPEGGQP